ncbi:hypothetical protein C2G38_2233532 [Gigaspora rosea]|uniref:Uncharacterized protein n=1 Tax=Gigaspora rosea TaxID=44941 RepID=A0A397TZS6_9GLOM|nr:hypothetical protein C2G38_2233532 [Gigaspora rosea]
MYYQKFAKIVTISKTYTTRLYYKKENKIKNNKNKSINTEMDKHGVSNCFTRSTNTTTGIFKLYHVPEALEKNDNTNLITKEDISIRKEKKETNKKELFITRNLLKLQRLKEEVRNKDNLKESECKMLVKDENAAELNNISEAFIVDNCYYDKPNSDELYNSKSCSQNNTSAVKDKNVEFNLDPVKDKCAKIKNLEGLDNNHPNAQTWTFT